MLKKNSTKNGKKTKIENWPYNIVRIILCLLFQNSPTYKKGFR